MQQPNIFEQNWLQTSFVFCTKFLLQVPLEILMYLLTAVMRIHHQPVKMKSIMGHLFAKLFLVVIQK